MIFLVRNVRVTRKRRKTIDDMTYFEHLLKNWKVAFHALTDFFAHFVHGIFPFIKIRHHQPTKEADNE